MSSAFQSTWSSVLDTTYFFAASIVRPKGSIQSGILRPRSRSDGRQADSIISYVTRPRMHRVGALDGLRRVAVRLSR